MLKGKVGCSFGPVVAVDKREKFTIFGIEVAEGYRPFNFALNNSQVESHFNQIDVGDLMMVMSDTKGVNRRNHYSEEFRKQIENYKQSMTFNKFQEFKQTPQYDQFEKAGTVSTSLYLNSKVFFVARLVDDSITDSITLRHGLKFANNVGKWLKQYAE